MTPPPRPRDATTRTAPSLSRTAWALAALVAGLVPGILLHGSTQAWVGKLAAIIAPIGQLWVAALRLTVVPLVITQAFAAIVRARSDRSTGVLGVKALLLFVIMLLAAGLLTLVIAPPLVALYPADAQTAASLRAGTSIPESALEAARERQTSLGDRVAGLVPGNIFQALSSGEILPVLLFTIFFALAVSHLAPERREPLNRVFQALGDAMMTLIGWILKATPLGVCVLAFEMAIQTGVQVTGFLAAFVAIVSAVLILFTVLLYPVTAILGRIPIRRFARAVAPAQLVAASTRSSLASLPALVEGAQEHLGLPAPATGFVLPLSVSAFKVNRTISSTVKLLFLAHVFHVHLGPFDLATFLVTVLVLSFSTPGIPGGSAFLTLPAYLAAGVPIEGVVILETVITIPDIFRTLLNVTGDMSAAAILSRSLRKESTA